MQLTNVQISNPKHIKTGTKTTAEGKSWEWQLWNVTINGDKYTFFPRKGYTPQDGDQMVYVEYEESQDVGSDGTVYNNRTVRDYKPVANQEATKTTTQPTSVSANNNGLNISFCLGYCKDLILASIEKEGFTLTFEEYVSLIVKLAKQMQTETMGEVKVEVEVKEKPAEPNPQVNMAKFFDAIAKLKGDYPTDRFNEFLKKFNVGKLGDIVDYKAQLEFHQAFKGEVAKWEEEKSLMDAPPADDDIPF